MPFYKFICTECGHLFDKQMPISQYKSIANCPKCNSESKRDVKDIGLFKGDKDFYDKTKVK